MVARTLGTLCMVALVLLVAQAQASLKLASQWVHGAPREHALQVHEAAPGFWILRQSKRTNFEAPFMYLIAGEDRALLLDTGADPEDGSELPLRAAIDRLLNTWQKRHPGSTELIVAHTHSHRDHTAGDDQFRQRPRTRVVGTAPEEIATFFGLSSWPAGEANLDLGGRTLVVFPLPGHEPSHIALYDSTTRTLLTGDSLYPGLLTVRDLTAYRASAAHLSDFAGEHDIDQVLGAHIEMTSAPRTMYPLETRFQPDEHALALQSTHIDDLQRTIESAGDFRSEVKRNDFALFRVLASSQDKPATHGMLLVGTRSLYLSHLPMFHAPHDYQAIIEVELATDALEAYRRDTADHPGMIYTVAPTQKSILDQLIQEGARFSVDLYRGHFERGGTPILRDIMVTVRRVVHHRRFGPADRPDPSRWIAFGRAGEAFLAHRIQGAPDADVIVQLDGPVTTGEGEEIRRDEPNILDVGDAIGPAQVSRVIYLERDDLR